MAQHVRLYLPFYSGSLARPFECFTSLFSSSDKAVETAAETGKTIVDGIVSGFDKICFTDEEKADYSQKAQETVLKFWETVSKENTEQSKARRDLAKMTFKVFFFLLLVALVLFRIDVEHAKFALQLAEKISFLISAIAVIYFGPHQISKVWKKDEGS